MKKPMLKFYDDTGQKIWETKDRDVDKLLDTNSPENKFCDTLKTLKRKMG